MPMVDIIYPEGALSCDAQVTLLGSLRSTCLRWEGIPETAATGSIAWVYLDERPCGSITVGGAPLDQPVYRAHVRMMSGFMEQPRVDGLVREATEAIVRADGTDGIGGPPVFCIVEEVPSRTWAVDGVVWHSDFTAESIGADPARVAGIRRAVAANPRIEVPLSAPVAAAQAAAR
jgi:phenylpyruvate tautomerase PptA (4-oxalocrotonate tautomerase family)